MYRGESIASEDRESFYRSLTEQVDALLSGERDSLANLANVASLIYLQLAQLNWAGFYLLRDGELVLGPFQGKPACTRIAIGQGVCGRAVETGESQIVADVHAFPGHIACDPESRSELVIPVRHEGRIIGVLDLDSPVTERFDAVDEEHFRQLMHRMVQGSDIEDLCL